MARGGPRGWPDRARRRERGPTARSGEGRRIKELERELRRKDKALAEAAALLVLQKKFHTYLEERDNDTEEENEK